MFVRVGAANDQRWNDNKENAMNEVRHTDTNEVIGVISDRYDPILPKRHLVFTSAGPALCGVSISEAALAYAPTAPRCDACRVESEKFHAALMGVDTCEGYGPAPLLTCAICGAHECGCDDATCSMCGASTHTERERTDDGEWNEDCEFVPFFDGDGRDLRRPGQAGRSR